RHSAESQMPRVPGHVEECDRAGPALGRVHPVARRWILCDVTLAAIPDVETVQRVICNRKPNPEELQKEDKWDAAQKFNLLRICAGSLGCEGVGYKMLNQKQTYRNHPRQRMQSTKQE